MTEARIKVRPIGASARVSRKGHPQVISRTGGEIDVMTGASDEGFNPLDLMFASLSACLVLSARIAASRIGVFERFEGATADVTGKKSEGEPARLTDFFVEIRIDGDLTDDERHQITVMAEDICTVSNTLRTPPIITIISR